MVKIYTLLIALAALTGCGSSLETQGSITNSRQGQAVTPNNPVLKLDEPGFIYAAEPATISPEHQNSNENRPNFIVIFTDDQGYADIGSYGGTHVKTPRLDELAQEGAKLTNFYAAAAVCTPSRAALMTGSYPVRNGMNRVLLAGDKLGLHPDELTVAEILKTVGYKTGMVGKWHLGDQPQFLPTRQGFDEFYGLPYSHDIHPYHPNNKKYNFPPLPLLEMEKVVEQDPDADFLTRRFTERAVSFIEKNKEQPFFLYLAHPIPHRPIHMSPPFMDRIPKPIKQKLAHEKKIDYRTRDGIYSYAISEIDWSVGQILDALQKNGIDKNTIVFFSSDNGPSIGKTTPLTGRKGSTYEGGMRVPGIIRWPGKIPGGENRGLVTAMDILPTFAKLAGAKVPGDRVIDGKDVMPLLTGKEATPHQAFFYYKQGTLKAVRSGKWKLHIGSSTSKLTEKKPTSRGKGATSSITALYDLDTDPAESVNLLAEYPQVAKKLLSYTAAFERDLQENSRQVGVEHAPRTLTKSKQVIH